MAINKGPWEPGDVVKLLSGGPDMTVETIRSTSDGASILCCSWFIQDGEGHWNGPFASEFFPTAVEEATPSGGY